MTHTFAPGSGPLPDSDPDACDVCGEFEDHFNHNVPDPSLDDEVSEADYFAPSPADIEWLDHGTVNGEYVRGQDEEEFSFDTDYEPRFLAEF